MISIHLVVIGHDRQIWSEELDEACVSILDVKGNRTPYRFDGRFCKEFWNKHFLATPENLKWYLQVAVQRAKRLSDDQPGFRIRERWTDHLDDFIKMAMPRGMVWEKDGCMYHPASIPAALRDEANHCFGGAR